MPDYRRRMHPLTGFTGYPDGALPLLTRLGGVDPAGFALARLRYQAEIALPTKEFVHDLGAELRQRISDGIQAVASVHGSISPITNDLRFHARPPYKDHLVLRFWEGDDKRTAPTLFLRLQQDHVGFGSGISPDGPGLARYRDAVAADSGAELATALRRLQRRRGAELAGQELRRVPAGFDPDGPRADLLRHRWLQIRWQEPTPKAVGSSRFVSWCAARLERSADVHRWLRDHV